MADLTLARRKDSQVTSAGSLSSVFRDDEGNEPTERNSKRSKRGELTQNACIRCRAKKSKCDGVRPTCGRCAKSGVVCDYDVATEGMSKMQSLQQKLDSRHYECDRLQQIMHALQHSSDYASTELLARLRIGQSLAELLEFAHTSSELPTNSLEDGAAYLQPLQGQQQQAFESWGLRYQQGWPASTPNGPAHADPWQGVVGDTLGRPSHFVGQEMAQASLDLQTGSNATPDPHYHQPSSFQQQSPYGPQDYYISHQHQQQQSLQHNAQHQEHQQLQSSEKTYTWHQPQDDAR